MLLYKGMGHSGRGLGAGERGLGLVDGGRVGEKGALAALLWTQKGNLGSCHCTVVSLHGSLNGREKFVSNFVIECGSVLAGDVCWELHGHFQVRRQRILQRDLTPTPPRHLKCNAVPCHLHHLPTLGQ